MHTVHVVGARPNFMKAAPVVFALAGRPGVEQRIVHTGQHYDANMSEVFFRQLGLPEPDVNLEVGSGTHAEQTAQIMLRFEKVVAGERPDWVVVYGDVNSTVAASLVAAKLGIRVAHVEAGLRSFDWTMPEEINRVVTDRLADLLLTPSRDADENLAREGVPADRIVLVGNCMIDTLKRLLPRASRPSLDGVPDRYALVTLHRPSNVDDADRLRDVMGALDRISERIPVVFPVHPRTRTRMAQAGVRSGPRVVLTEPVGYLEFLGLQKDAAAVITDSGGIQEETTFLGVPCLTIRENTERPVTVGMGTNRVIGGDPRQILPAFDDVLGGRWPRGQPIPLWDGDAGSRVAEALCESGSARVRRR
jgi:UDP-N-acetylglucosamine 2-epimerase (non-hydrolysing)